MSDIFIILAANTSLAFGFSSAVRILLPCIKFSATDRLLVKGLIFFSECGIPPLSCYYSVALFLMNSRTIRGIFSGELFLKIYDQYHNT